MADEKTSSKSSDQTLSPTASEKHRTGSSSSRASSQSTSSGSGEQAHPLKGKSLPYVRGAGAESYSDGENLSDKVNEEPHFNR